MNHTEIDAMTDSEIAEACAKAMMWSRDSYRCPWEWPDGRYAAGYGFDPCTDANDDEIVQKYTMQFPQADLPGGKPNLQALYFCRLHEVWIRRCKMKFPNLSEIVLAGVKPIWAVRETGDYARALLHALAESEVK
jgi:hypothetical protein